MTTKDRVTMMIQAAIIGGIYVLTNATGEFSFFVAYLLALTAMIFFATYKAVDHAIKNEKRAFYWICSLSGVAVGGVLFSFAIAVAPVAK
jgi:drug/metabolite transporter (DMT)-like permease